MAAVVKGAAIWSFAEGVIAQGASTPRASIEARRVILISEAPAYVVTAIAAGTSSFAYLSNSSSASTLQGAH